MKNEFEINGALTWIRLERRDRVPIFAMVDTKDLRKLLEHPVRWIAQYSPESKTFYVAAGNSSPKVYLHRFLVDAPKGSEVDHKNHNGLDNRRFNLVVGTKNQNQQNRKGPRKGSLSGASGVVWSSRKQRWLVKRMVNGVVLRAGQFSDLEEAKKAAQILYKNAGQ